jgi:hypothetical protein
LAELRPRLLDARLDRRRIEAELGEDARIQAAVGVDRLREQRSVPVLRLA